jgi:predicted permease
MQLPQSVIQSLTLFLYLAIGFVCAKSGVLKQDQTRGISRLLVNVTLPALIFVSMLKPYDPALLPQIFSLIGISFAVYGLCIALGFGIFSALKTDERKAGVYRFGIAFSNVGFMGYPVIEALFGKESLFAAAIYNIAFQVLTFSVGILMLKPRNRESSIRIRNLVLNPNIIAAGLGLAFFFLRLSLPVQLTGALGRLGDVTTPLSMIFIGATLSRASFGQVFLDWKIWLVSAFRALILPVGLYFCLKPLSSFMPFPIEIPVMIAAMPVAANAAILAEEYGADPETASALITLSTLICMVAIPILARLLFAR